jgi:hypothetical protein
VDYSYDIFSFVQNSKLESLDLKLLLPTNFDRQKFLSLKKIKNLRVSFLSNWNELLLRMLSNLWSVEKLFISDPLDPNNVDEICDQLRNSSIKELNYPSGSSNEAKKKINRVVKSNKVRLEIQFHFKLMDKIKGNLNFKFGENLKRKFSSQENIPNKMIKF